MFCNNLSQCIATLKLLPERKTFFRTEGEAKNAKREKMVRAAAVESMSIN